MGKRIFLCTVVNLGLTLPLFLVGTAVNAQGPISTTGWEDSLANVPTPYSGCFVSSYPSESWQPTTCSTPPSQPLTVGNGNDWSVQTSGKLIGQTRGSFFTS